MNKAKHTTNTNNRFGCFTDDADDVKIPNTTSNPLRKKRKQLSKLQEKYNKEPTPELSTRISQLKQDIDKLENPDKYRYKKPTKSKPKKKVDKSKKYQQQKSKNYKNKMKFNNTKQERKQKQREREAKQKHQKQQKQQYLKQYQKQQQYKKQQQDQKQQQYQKQYQKQQQQQQKPYEIPIDCPSDIKSLNKHYCDKLYRKIALKYHPDKCKYDSTKWMKLINNIRDFKLNQ